MMALKLTNITKRFGGLVALNNVSLEINQGEIVGLIGPNGAGKSTLLNAISGIDPPTEGKVEFFNRDTTGFTPERMCHLGLSKTFQIPHPFPKLSVLDNVMMATVFGNREDPVADPISHSRAQLETVEFAMEENTLSMNLNAVQLKRLDLARALASSPKLLLLDEVASGLTEGELTEIIAIIKKIHAQGVTIFIVEHIMQVIMNLCEKLVVINFGHKIAEGRADIVADDPVVKEAYLGTDD